MKEIELLQLEEDDSTPLSESLLRESPCMTSRDIGSFQSVAGLAHSTASGSHRLLHHQDTEGHSGQSLSQQLNNQMAPPDQNGSAS